jgi:DNA-binding FadR family transcriptional regulator
VLLKKSKRLIFQLFIEIAQNCSNVVITLIFKGLRAVFHTVSHSIFTGSVDCRYSKTVSTSSEALALGHQRNL